jgi:hypothetical protein
MELLVRGDSQFFGADCLGGVGGCLERIHTDLLAVTANLFKLDEAVY